MLIVSQAVPINTSVICMARVLGNAGAPITQASLSTITYSVYDLTAGAVVSSGSVTISSAVFDNLQTADRTWTQDSPASLGVDGLAGYNLKYTVPSTAFATAGDRYQVDFVITPLTGQPFRVSIQFPTYGVFS